MNRWTGSWLGGPGSAGLTPAHTVYKGERLGLPEAERTRTAESRRTQRCMRRHRIGFAGCAFGEQCGQAPETPEMPDIG